MAVLSSFAGWAAVLEALQACKRSDSTFYGSNLLLELKKLACEWRVAWKAFQFDAGAVRAWEQFLAPFEQLKQHFDFNLYFTTTLCCYLLPYLL